MTQIGSSVTAQAIAPTGRTLRWLLFALVAATTIFMVWSGARRGADPLTFHLPAAGAFLAVWLAFQTGDAAEVTLSASPTTLLRRRALRTGIAAAAACLVWAGLCVQASAGPKTATLSAFFVATLCVAAAASAVGERIVGTGRGGPVASAVLFVVFALLPAFFHVPWTMDPATDAWSHLYGRWLLIAGIAVLVYLLARMDPAQRHFWARPPRDFGS